ncbi:DUF1996 domain-containing protein [Cryptosporangium sp. NPDC048952]|uniref:DUF1996 domain-containing protein n=1 Tax=Cryptosporangium sp. NPDC048952 TaxID=3363961 RepID=UPI00371D6A2D
MTGPKRHKRPPNQFRRRSLIIMAVVTTMVVALGVGTASAGLRGDRQNQGWKQAGQKYGHGHGRPTQSGAPEASSTADPANEGEEGDDPANPDDTASPDASATEGQGDGNQGDGQGDDNGQGDGNQGDGQGDGNQGEDPAEGGGEETEAPDNGIDENDYIDIRQVQPKQQQRIGRAGSSGTFSVRCSLQNRHNSDNYIAAPGIGNGAHHVHDYTGNTTTDANSTDESLAAAGTTCNKGDKSPYFWPVIRDVTADTTTRFPGELEEDLNTGALLKPRFTIQFQGNPKSKVTAMPEFLRVLAGDAKSSVNGGANQRAQFTCQGFTNRISTDKYTLCPNGRGFTRIGEFPSCWDGQNTDTANHRDHMKYPDAQGNCPASNPVVVPKLVITMIYNVKPGPTFRLDSFPESTHEPISDHNDFENVMPQNVMNQLVQCLNTGRRC